MASLPCEYVVTGGKLKCTGCAKPDTEVEIRATHDSGIFPQGKKACTVEDKIPFLNIPSFGKCKRTGRKCVPLLLRWTIPNPVSSNNLMPLLVKRAWGRCIFSGRITVEDSGQVTMPGEGDAAALEEFMELVSKIEEAYPDWTKEQVLTELNALAGYRNWQFMGVIGANSQADYQRLFGDGPLQPVAGVLSQADINRMGDLLRHGFDANGNETGVMTDSHGNDFVMGHTLLGILAGANRDTNGGPGVNIIEGATGAAGVAADTAGVGVDTAGVVVDGTGYLVQGGGIITDGAGYLVDGAGIVTDGAGYLADGTGAACDGFNWVSPWDIPGCDNVSNAGDSLHDAADSVYGAGDSVHGAADTLYQTGGNLHDTADGLYDTADGLYAGADNLYGATDSIDNLPAATISGDLGQSAAFVNGGQHVGTGQHTYIGPGTEATYAELTGDIDGMIIGEAIGGNVVGNPIREAWNNPDMSFSDFLGQYHDDYANSRFANAHEWLPTVNGADYMENEVSKFANNYEHFIDPKTNPLARLWGDDTTDTDAAAEAANSEFNDWVEEQYIQEQLNGKMTDGTCGGGD